jgi:hypothetical protein
VFDCFARWRSLCAMARSARCDVRWVAAVFVESDETIVSQISSVLDAFRRLLLQIGGANIAGADRASWPPTSSSFRDEQRVPSLPVHCSLRSLRLALVSRCLPRSQSLARPGQRRVSLAQHGGARSGVLWTSSTDDVQVHYAC